MPEDLFTIDDAMRYLALEDARPLLDRIAASVLVSGDWVWIDAKRFEQLLPTNYERIPMVEILAMALVRTKTPDRPHEHCRLAVGWVPKVML